MITYRNLLIFLLLMHSIVSAWVFKSVPIIAVVPPFDELHTTQIFSDLAVSISIVFLFIHRELCRLKKPMKLFYICLVAMIFTGSFAPLAYLLWDKELLNSDAQR